MSDQINKNEGQDGNLIAYKIQFDGPATYPQAFEDAGFGLVLDDDGDTGYLYVTSVDFEEVHDSLHIYNSTGPESPKPGEEIHLVYNPALVKVGLYYRDKFWAVVDYSKSKACCRSGQPVAKPGGWCTSSHSWDDKMVAGLTFRTIQHGGPAAPQA